MATPAQIAANQQNAQLSTGARTEAGKLTVSRNALVHSLAATNFYLADEDKPLFDELHDGLLEHYKPATAHERSLVEDFAQARWRLRTARIMETAFLDTVVSEMRKADKTLSVERALAQLFLDATQQKRMRLLMRYLSTATRGAEQARKELERVIGLRRAEERQRAEFHAFMGMRVPAGAPPNPQPTTPESENRVCSVTPQKR